MTGVGKILDGSGNPVRFWLNPKCDMPVGKKTGFLVSYWVVKEARDSTLANLERDTLGIRLSSSGLRCGEACEPVVIYIPVMVNSKAIKAGDELLKRSASASATPSKAARTA